MAAGRIEEPVHAPRGAAAAILGGMHIAFLGFGLIAGSIARAVRASRGLEAGRWPPGRRPAMAAERRGRMVSWTRRRDVAEHRGVAGADLVVLGGARDGLSRRSSIELAGPWRSALPDAAVVTDVASTKAGHRRPRRTPPACRFVGGHPMAGLDTAGYGVADGGPVRRSTVGRRARGARRAAGRRARRVDSRMRAGPSRSGSWTPPTHDRAVAGISHLPLVVAAALVGGGRRAAADRTTDGRGAPGRRWLARHDPCGTRRPGDGRRRSLATNAPAVAGPDPRPARGPRRVARRPRADRDPDGPRGRTSRAARPSRGGARAASARDRERGARLRRARARPSRTRPAGTACGRDGLDDFVGRPRSATAGTSRATRWNVIPPFKQVIPYLVLRDGPRYFLMQRTRPAATPGCTAAIRSASVGTSTRATAACSAALRREWREELVADFVPAFRLIALLNDDTTEVGAVHLGAVYVADAAGRPVADPRDRQADRRVRRTVRGRRRRRRMETWSRLVFESCWRRRGPSTRRAVVIRAALPVASLAAVASVVTLRIARATRRHAVCSTRRGRRRTRRRSGPALDALGGEIVRFGSRDGLRLAARWLPAETRRAGRWRRGWRRPARGDPAAPRLVRARSRRTSSSTARSCDATAGVLGLDFRGHGGSDDVARRRSVSARSRTSPAPSPGSASAASSASRLVGTSMGGITALAAVAVLGDGSLPSADADRGRARAVDAGRAGRGSSRSSPIRCRRSSSSRSPRDCAVRTRHGGSSPAACSMPPRAQARRRSARDRAVRVDRPARADPAPAHLTARPTRPSRSPTPAGWPPPRRPGTIALDRPRRGARPGARDATRTIRGGVSRTSCATRSTRRRTRRWTL